MYVKDKNNICSGHYHPSVLKPTTTRHGTSETGLTRIPEVPGSNTSWELASLRTSMASLSRYKCLNIKLHHLIHHLSSTRITDQPVSKLEPRAWKSMSMCDRQTRDRTAQFVI
jgi:hypothetical protein